MASQYIRLYHIHNETTLGTFIPSVFVATGMWFFDAAGVAAWSSGAVDPRDSRVMFSMVVCTACILHTDAFISNIHAIPSGTVVRSVHDSGAYQYFVQRWSPSFLYPALISATIDEMRAM